MDNYPWLTKCVAVGIILLFLGIAIAPSIKFIVVKASNDTDVVIEGKADRTQRTSSLFHSPVPVVFVQYPSCIMIEYDKDSVNQTKFISDIAYSIPLSIGYRVWVPDWIFNSSFHFLRNWYLFHSLIPPMMPITLSVENVPTWADIYLSSTTIIVEIGNDFHRVPTDLIVHIHNQAPPGPFTVSLIAEAPAIHRINEYVNSRNITITVQ